ncbi:Crp/Fnr family transcriptional regulator [Geojedonia litorea]|uniref:Crp/Fnr family transcriptional regulator n=1 Tax=Geojedonia litorea TaxID=1268269 RepID=A0ABV9N4A1_9FLAO
MNTKPFLDYILRYVDLTPEEINLLLDNISHRSYLKGQYIVQQGDICRFESFVVNGCVKTFYVDDDGQEHVVLFAIENWWAADLGSFLSQEPADYNVQCIENTEVIQFSFEQLEMLYQNIPKLERFFRIIIQNAFVASQRRVIKNFSLPAKERYIEFKSRYPQIEQRVPQYLIASYLGVTKEFLSKIKSQLLQDQ